MSANAWKMCPRCEKLRADEIERLDREAAEAYGKVSQKEWDALREAFRNLPPLEETFREDYETGVWKGEFSVDYFGSCRVCGLKKKFEYKEVLDL